MRKHILSRITLALVCSLSLIYLNTADAFADNPYNIVYYSGDETGVPGISMSRLGEGNVDTSQDAIDMIGGLSELVNGGDVDLKVSDSERWEGGYLRSGGVCREGKFIRVPLRETFVVDENLYYTFSNGGYTARVQLLNVAIENWAGTSQNSFVAVFVSKNAIYAGYYVYTEPDCTNRVGASRLVGSAASKVFVELDIKLYRRGDYNDVYSADGVYMRFDDIDIYQSYKILNQQDEFTAMNMYATSLSILQPTTSTMGENKFVEDSINGNYIFASGNFGADKSRLYVPISKDTQEDGLNIVFGFGSAAGSAIAFYAHQYVVTYQSDENGVISDIDSEHVVAGASPAGSATTPNEGCSLTHWIADQDVLLNNGIIIPQGTPITVDEIKQVKVNSNLKFTAYHVCVDPDEPDVPDVPDSGEFTGKNNTSVVVSSIMLSVVLCLGLVLCCAFVWLLRMLAKSL